MSDPEVPPDDAEHEIGVRFFGVLPFGWCSCGWEGPTHESMAHEHRAADDARAHLRSVRDHG